MLRIVQNRLRGAAGRTILAEHGAGVGVAIESREVAARDLEPDAMAGTEQIRRRSQIDRDLRRFAWREQLRRRLALTVARTQDAVAKCASGAVWKHVDECSG